MKIVLICCEDIEKINIGKYFGAIEPLHRKKAEGMHSERAQAISVLAELAVRCEAAAYLNMRNSEIKIIYNRYGKPMLSDVSGFHFSISHTDDCICTAFGSSPIGVDIEKLRSAKMSIARRFFTADENMLLEQSKTPDALFYEIWTSKEAYVKMLGTGLNTPFNSFDVNEPHISALITSRIYDGYVVSVCSEEKKDCPASEMTAGSLIENINSLLLK